MKHSVLLDTSFFIRLLNDEDPLHSNARGYFRYYLEQEIALLISTISIAEYCVKGNLEDLPLRKLQIVPFNAEHAVRAGKFARVLFEANKVAIEKLYPRAIIPNDAKLFAQADIIPSVLHFVTSDHRSLQTRNRLKAKMEPKFDILDISVPHNEAYGLLDL